MTPRVLLIDNYDSFTFNLVQGFRMLGADVVVHRNDQVSVAEALEDPASHLVISPGPGTPDDAGISVALLQATAGRLPTLGVCLGHQSLAVAWGGVVGRASRLMHGKTSSIEHDGQGLFRGLPNPVDVGRYHSLSVNRTRLPEGFDVTASADDGEIMGMRHRELPVEGVQFHPESVLTPLGQRMLANFLGLDVTAEEGSTNVEHKVNA